LKEVGFSCNNLLSEFKGEHHGIWANAPVRGDGKLLMSIWKNVAGDHSWDVLGEDPFARAEKRKESEPNPHLR